MDAHPPKPEAGTPSASAAAMRNVRRVRRAGYLGELFGAENISHLPLGFLLTLAGITLVLMVSLPAFISVQRNEETLAHLLAE